MVFQTPGEVKPNHLIHVLCLERCSAGTSLISLLCSKPLALPLQEYMLLFLCSAVNPRDGHFSSEDKNAILYVLKLNSSFKGIFWDTETYL